MLKISTKKFDPANWPEGVWATYADGVRFKIRKLTGDAIRELRRPYTRQEMELNPASRRMEQVEKIDSEKFDEVLAGYLIEVFEGIGDDDGRVLPDSPESRKAILNIPVLRDFIWAAAQSLEIAQQEKADADVKN